MGVSAAQPYTSDRAGVAVKAVMRMVEDGEGATSPRRAGGNVRTRAMSGPAPQTTCAVAAGLCYGCRETPVAGAGLAGAS